MSKKINIYTDSSLLDGLQVKLPILAVTLKVGEWRMLFGEQEFNILITEALNKTLLNESYIGALVGYLITHRKIYLILKIRRQEVHKMLYFFYDVVKVAIQYRFARKKENLLSEYEMDNEHLFEPIPLRNEYLIKLITGRKVEIAYYSPTLERFKEQIRNYNFCSAIDYSGAIGPVLVTKIKYNEIELL